MLTHFHVTRRLVVLSPMNSCAVLHNTRREQCQAATVLAANGEP